MNSKNLQMRASVAPQGRASHFAILASNLDSASAQERTSHFAICALSLVFVFVSSWYFGYNYFAL